MVCLEAVCAQQGMLTAAFGSLLHADSASSSPAAGAVMLCWGSVAGTRLLSLPFLAAAMASAPAHRISPRRA